MVCIDEFQQIGEMPMSDKVVNEQTFKEGLEATNLIRAICAGSHDDFGKKEVTSQYDLGSRSNLVKLKKALIEREIIEQTEEGLYISDPLFEIWFKREMR